MDISLYAIVEDFKDAKEAAKGGASVIQLRRKDLADGRFLELAVQIREVLEGYKIPLFVNDRIDIALASGANGVHLGQCDLPIDAARRICGDEFPIGLTIDSIDDLDRVNALHLEYVAIGPVFQTNSKELKKPVLGLEGLIELRKATSHKVVAIGGIDDSNARSVIDAGADGVAVLSYIKNAEDKSLAVSKLKDEIYKAKVK